MPPLTILSCGILPNPTRLSEWGAWADDIYGSAKLLKLSASFEERGIKIGADARQKAQEALTASREGKNVLFLASGDALFHGIGGTICSLSNIKDELRFIPAETAFQVLFHRLGLAWDNARLFSVHSSQEPPFAEILSARLSVIYGGNYPIASDIAKLCIEFLPSCSNRNAVLAENLGTQEEKILEGTLAELAQKTSAPTSLLVLLPPKQASQSPCLPLGLDNDIYTKKQNLITGEEVRAVILSKLKLPAWGVLWDIGAGSGSIGLESAGLRPDLQVLGLEKNESRLGMIQTNKRLLAVNNYTIQQGTAPEALESLPTPDRIFIGGGGSDLAGILNSCFDRLSPGGLMVASSVTMESLQTLYAWNPKKRVSFLELSISKEQPLAGKYHHLKPQNCIYLFTFAKP